MNIPNNHELTANAIFLNTISEYRGIIHRQGEEIKKLKSESTHLHAQLSVKTAELSGAQSMVSSLNQRLAHTQNSLRSILDHGNFDDIKEKQDTIVRMLSHLTDSSQSLMGNQQTMMANMADRPPAVSKIIRVPTAVVTTPGSVPNAAVVTTPGSVPNATVVTTPGAVPNATVVTTPGLVPNGGWQPSKPGPVVHESTPMTTTGASLVNGSTTPGPIITIAGGKNNQKESVSSKRPSALRRQLTEPVVKLRRLCLKSVQIPSEEPSATVKTEPQN